MCPRWSFFVRCLFLFFCVCLVFSFMEQIGEADRRGNKPTKQRAGGLGEKTKELHYRALEHRR